MNTDKRALAKQLLKLYESSRKYTWEQIQKKSGTNNLKKMIDEDRQFTSETWMRLHEAFPEHITRPIFRHGKERFFLVNQSDNQAAYAAGRDINIGKTSNKKN